MTPRILPLTKRGRSLYAGINVRFSLFNLIGACAWVVSLCLAGYWLGNLPWIKQNLSILILGIIAISLLPVAIGYVQHRRTA